MDKIRIDLSEVSEVSTTIKDINQQIFNLLSEMKSEVNSIDISWISSNSTLLKDKFNEFSKSFDLQKVTIDKYAQFLDHTVQSYEALESTISSNASSF